MRRPGILLEAHVVTSVPGFNIIYIIRICVSGRASLLCVYTMRITHFTFPLSIPEISLMTTRDFSYDATARRKRVNVTLNQDLLTSARKYKLNLSRLLEKTLISELTARWQDDWLDENKAAISDYNERIEKQGVFSDGLRRF